MIRTTLACIALAGLLAGCSKQATSAPDKASPAPSASARASAPGDDSPPEIELSDEPVVPAMENDESAGVKEAPAEDPEAEESEHGDYE